MSEQTSGPAPRKEAARDDLVLPFRIEASGLVGRLVRLGGVTDTILSRHAYPEPVAKVLGTALTLATMLGSALKTDSKLILQTKTDGPLGFLVVQFDSPGSIRGYASFDAGGVDGLVRSGPVAEGALIGHGHLAMTIDPGGRMDRYQGIVPIDAEPLVEAALTYFRQSEQIPTFIRLAVARGYVGGEGADKGWHWRAGGLMLQHVTAEAALRQDLRERVEGLGAGADPEENWERARILAATVEDHELLDPTLSPERLLYRLFHEEGVRAFRDRTIAAHCTCSRERLARLLGGFSAEEIEGMVEADGLIRATCEFCRTVYGFERGEVGKS